MSFGCCKKVFGVSFERVSDFEWTRSVTHSNAFGVLFERVWLLVQTCLASRSNPFGFLFEMFGLLVWTRLVFVRTRFIQRSNASRLWSERVHTRSKLAQTKNALYLVPDGYCISCSSINKLDNFELFIDHQHYFSSFKLLRHSSHFTKFLFDRQCDYCSWAIKPRLCSNWGFI